MNAQAEAFFRSIEHHTGKLDATLCKILWACEFRAFSTFLGIESELDLKEAILSIEESVRNLTNEDLDEVGLNLNISSSYKLPFPHKASIRHIWKKLKAAEQSNGSAMDECDPFLQSMSSPGSTSQDTSARLPTVTYHPPFEQIEQKPIFLPLTQEDAPESPCSEPRRAEKEPTQFKSSKRRCFKYIRSPAGSLAKINRLNFIEMVQERIKARTEQLTDLVIENQDEIEVFPVKEDFPKRWDAVCPFPSCTKRLPVYSYIKESSVQANQFLVNFKIDCVSEHMRTDHSLEDNPPMPRRGKARKEWMERQES